MYDIQWEKVFEIGVDCIDNEHREMIRIVNKMKKACEQQNYSECHQIASRLVRYSIGHFQHEEDYLEKVGFPRLNSHKKYHNELLQEVDTIRKNCTDLSVGHSVQECLDSMEQLIIDDILTGDNDFVSFLEYNGYASPKVFR